MNNKRQTIWLVSMLSLMVILSAYYLFTDDSGKATPPVADSTQASNQKSGTTTSTLDELVLNEVTPEGMVGDSGASEVTDSVANDEGKQDSSEGKQDQTTNDKENEKTTEPKESKEPKGDAKAGQSTGTEDTAKTEEDILGEVAAQANSAGSKIEAYQLDRANKNMKLYDELMTKLGNQENTAEETAQVTEQLKTLEEREQILLSLEEELQQQYEKAVVKEENNRYNVVVLGDQLDAKGAAVIVNKVMSELKVSQDKVSVQIVKQ